MAINIGIFDDEKEAFRELRLSRSARPQIDDRWRRSRSVAIDEIGKISILRHQHSLFTHRKIEQPCIQPIRMALGRSHDIMPLICERPPDTGRDVDVEQEPQAVRA